MRLPRMTTRRWMVATAAIALFCWAELRGRALQQRAAFHARERQSCLRDAQNAEKNYLWMNSSANSWCGPRVQFIEIAEDFEEAPAL